MKRIEISIVALLVVMYAVGTAGHLIADTRPLMLTLTPYILVFLGLLPLAMSFKAAPAAERGRLAAWCLLTYAGTFALEALGVATGLVFGAYAYGATLGPHVLGVPVVIGFNWLLVVAAALYAADRLIEPTTAARAVAGALLAGVLTVVFDWVMEPVAMRLDYWDWRGGVIPLQNYVAWFLIATASAFLFRLFRLSLRSYVPVAYGAIQLVFFLLLRLFLV